MHPDDWPNADAEARRGALGVIALGQGVVLEPVTNANGAHNRLCLTDEEAFRLAALLVEAAAGPGGTGTVTLTAGYLAGQRYYLVPVPDAPPADGDEPPF